MDTSFVLLKYLSATRNVLSVLNNFSPGGNKAQMAYLGELHQKILIFRSPITNKLTIRKLKCIG